MDKVVVKLDFLRALRKYYLPGEKVRVRVGIFAEFRETIDINADAWSFTTHISGIGCESGLVTVTGDELSITFPNAVGSYQIHINGSPAVSSGDSDRYIVTALTSDTIEVVPQRPPYNPPLLAVNRTYSCSCSNEIYNIAIREEFGTTLGAHVWDSAVIMLRHMQIMCIDPRLLTEGPPLSGKAGGLRVLELGAGCGLVSIALALSGLFASVVATDKPAQMDLLQRNISINKCGDKVVGLPLDWAEPRDFSRVMAEHGSDYDLLIAADVLYDAEAAEQLFRLLRRLSSCSSCSSSAVPPPPVIIAQKIRADTHRKAIDLTKLVDFSAEKIVEEASVVIWKLCYVNSTGDIDV